MKKTLLTSLLAALLPAAASARLFDSPAQLGARLDQGLSDLAGSFPFDAVQRGYVRHLSVEAGFFEGKCLRISYRLDTLPTDSLCDLLLEKNRGESTWKKLDEDTWTREDGLAFAKRENGTLWIIATELAPDWDAFVNGRWSQALLKKAVGKL